MALTSSSLFVIGASTRYSRSWADWGSCLAHVAGSKKAAPTRTIPICYWPAWFYSTKDSCICSSQAQWTSPNAGSTTLFPYRCCSQKIAWLADLSGSWRAQVDIQSNLQHLFEQISCSLFPPLVPLLRMQGCTHLPQSDRAARTLSQTHLHGVGASFKAEIGQSHVAWQYFSGADPCFPRHQRMTDQIICGRIV